MKWLLQVVEVLHDFRYAVIEFFLNLVHSIIDVLLDAMIVKFMPSQLPVLQIFHRLVYNIVLLLLVISVFAHLIHDGLDMFGRLLKNFLHLVEHRCNFTQRVLLVVTQANEPLLCHTILQNLEQL